MPRRKVRPEDRQRTNQACLACKASKKRCDSKLPCASCIRRGQVASCVYSDIDRRRRQHNKLNSYQHGAGQPNQQSPTDILPLPDHLHHSPLSNPPNPAFSTQPVTPDGSNDGVSGPSSTGVKAYVDETASSSFLHFLRKTLKPFVGSVPFTDDESYHTILEADIADVESDRPDVTPIEVYASLDAYFEATSGFLDLFTASEIDILIAAKTSPEDLTLSSSVRPEDAAALEVASAIGLQLRGLTDGSAHLANACFCRARRVAFEGMLMDQSLSMVRLFLLLAFYLLGTGHRNAAAMYLGVASKSAVVLALHQSTTYKGLERDERSVRLRTWNSLRNFDILASFLLGRPKSLPVVSYVTHLTEIAGEDDLQDSQPAFNAIVKGCSLLERAVDKLSRGNILHIPTAEGLLDELRQWNQALPHTLRQFTFNVNDGAGLDSADRQLLTGNIHVSCVYYFIVMLITRPFLIAYLISRLCGRAPDQLISDPEAALDMNIKNNTVSKLAQVCVSSAVYMADMCHRAMAFNFNFGNLCLLKAWIFGAGLVLGFCKFAGEPRKDIQDAFDGACEVLDSIALTDPQARHYHEILTKFDGAVEKYHRRVAGAVRHTVHTYIDQILILDFPQPVVPDPVPTNLFDSNSGHVNGNFDENLQGATSNVHLVDADAGLDDVPTLVDMDTYEEYQEDWDDFDAQLAESFILDVEPFEKLFYSVE